MVTRAAVLAPDLLWSAVAARYCALADDLVTATPRQRWHEHARGHLRARAAAHRRRRDLRARRGLDAPAAPRLLPRRRRPGPRRGGPRNPTRRQCSATSLDRYLAFVAPRSGPGRALSQPPRPRSTMDRTTPASTTAGDGRCGAWGPRPPAPSDDAVRRRAAEPFALSARWRCRHRRAMAFAALGAAEMLDRRTRRPRRAGAARRRPSGPSDARPAAARGHGRKRA